MSRALSEVQCFEPAQAGRSLKEVGTDYLNVEERNITSRWFHSQHDVDLFLWLDENNQVIKQQVSFCGQIVEWNVIEGVRTGLVIEEEAQGFDEADNSKMGASEIIRFDTKPQSSAIQIAIEVIRHVEHMEQELRQMLLTNLGLRFVGRQNSQSLPHLRTSQAVVANKNGQALNHSKLWILLSSLLSSLKIRVQTLLRKSK